MTRDYPIPLETLNDQIVEDICSELCGAKCCDFKLNDFSVAVFESDYQRLADAGYENLVTFQGSTENAQLLNSLDGKCIFLDSDTLKCRVYENRPLACRSYPFKKPDLDEIPDWCDLFHHSSKQLQKKMREKDFSVKHRDPDLEKLYDDYRKKGDLFLQERVENVFTLDGGNSYWNIYATREPDKKEINRIITGLQSSYKDEDWYVYSVRYFDKDVEFCYQVNGVRRKHLGIEVPFIETFPPDPNNLVKLLNEVGDTMKYKKHFVVGAEVPDEAFQ